MSLKHVSIRVCSVSLTKPCCASLALGNGTVATEQTLKPQTIVFKAAIAASPVPTRSPIALDDAVFRVCLREYPHLCMGLSLPDGVVEDGLPIQVKHYGRNEEKNLSFLKLEWHFKTLSRRFREETIAPLSKEDSCVAVSDEVHEGEILLLPCNESVIQEWTITVRGDSDTVALVNSRTQQCATVIKCTCRYQSAAFTVVSFELPLYRTMYRFRPSLFQKVYVGFYRVIYKYWLVRFVSCFLGVYGVHINITLDLSSGNWFHVMCLGL